MPRPIDRRESYLPGLDGLRAIAVGAVVAYHLGVEQLPGGLLGVGIFFTLSGFLITSILRSTWERTGGLDLRHFWVRRARRLLPAVVLLLVVVVAATALADPSDLPVRATEALASLLYVSNWTTIHLGVSYFQRINGPGPLDHLWSLAVEEQFYLFWPLILWGLIVVCKRRWGRVALATLVLAAVSFALMWVLATPGFDNTRAYEGTDTRAGGLLVGAVLGLLWRPERLPARIPLRGKVFIESVGVAALVCIGLLLTLTDQYSMFLYRGGILLLSVATAVLIVVCTHPASLMGRAVGVLPMRWVGERSYGIYLWHLPVIVALPEAVLAGSPWRPAVLVAIVVALAALSWALVEDPIRRRGLLGAFRRSREHQTGSEQPATAVLNRHRAPLLGSVAALVLVATAGLTALTLVGRPVASVAAAPAPGPSTAAATPTTPTVPTITGTPTASASAPSGAPAPTSGTPAPTAGAAPMTSCTKVDHIGDSTSEGLVLKNFFPHESDRIEAQYQAVGVQDVSTDVSGARSIVEHYEGNPNAEDAVKAKVATGYSGCWVFALGTNEAANQYVGGVWPYDKRIDLMMQHVGNQPVLWLTVKTLLPKGPYNEAGMQAWDDALVAACQRYPNMRVYDWAAEVQDSWYVSDKIHFTMTGYQQRARRIAQALAIAFPKTGSPPSSCLVRTPG